MWYARASKSDKDGLLWKIYELFKILNVFEQDIEAVEFLPPHFPGLYASAAANLQKNNK
jgi:hypothetical protein